MLLTAMLTLTSAFLLLAEEEGAASTTNGFITEYPIPVANSAPQSVVVESSGPPTTVWFTMPGANAVGKLVVTDANNFTFTTYTAGITSNSAPHDLVYDAANGLIWFTEPGNASLGRLVIASGAITEIAMPANHVPLNLDIAPNGRLYITSPSTNHVLSYNPNTLSFTTFPYSAAGGNPTDIEVLNNSSVWFTSPATKEAAELNPTTTNFIRIPLLDLLGGQYTPTGLTLDDLAPWIAASGVNRIGRYAEGTLSLWRWYQILPDNSGAASLAYTTSGDFSHLWYVQSNLGQVGRMTVDTANKDLVSVSAHSLSSAGSQPAGIAIDENGVAWITGKGNNVIAQWVPPYANFINLPLVVKP